MSDGSNSVLSHEQMLDLVDAVDEIEQQIETLQESKRDLMNDARERMEGAAKKDIKIAIAGIKGAVGKRRRERKGPEAVEAAEAVNELAEQLHSMRSHAPRATHANIPDWSKVKPAGGSQGGH